MAVFSAGEPRIDNFQAGSDVYAVRRSPSGDHKSKTRRELAESATQARELADATTPTTWRLRWITTVVLLRTVGHVLDNVDGARSPQLRAAIDRERKRVKARRTENLIVQPSSRRNVTRSLRSTRSARGSAAGGSGRHARVMLRCF